MAGKFFTSGAYAVIYLFSTEQFPTVIKNSGLGKSKINLDNNLPEIWCQGMCSLFARFGGLLCPIVVRMGTETWKPLPLFIFGGVSIVACLLTTLLPETHKKTLPTTLEEAERFGEDDNGVDEELEALK